MLYIKYFLVHICNVLGCAEHIRDLPQIIDWYAVAEKENDRLGKNELIRNNAGTCHKLHARSSHASTASHNLLR